MDATATTLLPGLPFNPTTGNEYSGDNVVTLLMAADAGSYPTAEWAGYEQWKAAGRQVRKGETATRIKRVVVVKDRKTGEDARRVTTLCVFNRAQTDEIAAESAGAA